MMNKQRYLHVSVLEESKLGVKIKFDIKEDKISFGYNIKSYNLTTV